MRPPWSSCLSIPSIKSKIGTMLPERKSPFPPPPLSPSRAALSSSELIRVRSIGSFSIDWPRQRSILHHARLTGSLPPEHNSHDHLNEQIQVPISSTLRASWRTNFEALLSGELRGGGEWRFFLVDGFLMFEDDESTREFDCRFFVRESYEVLKARREERQGYVSVVPFSNANGRES